MEVFINIKAFIDVNHLVRNSFINALQSSQGKRIAIAPANDVAKWGINEVNRRGLIYKEIYVYDKNISKTFPNAIYEYSDVQLQKPDVIYIVSEQLSDILIKRMLSLGAGEHTVVNIARHVPLLLPCDEVLKLIYSASDSEHTAYLNQTFGEDKLIIIHCPGFFYDMSDKLRILKKYSDAGIIWIENITNPVYDESIGAVKANMIDAINYISQRKRRSNIVFFSLNSAWHLVVPYLVRMAFNDIKIIIYMYEWLTYHFPYEHKEIFQQFTGLPAKYIEGEYALSQEILEGAIADGIIYKHGGGAFRILDGYTKPTLYFPPYISRHLFQPLPDNVKDPVNIVFLGALPSVMNDFELFEKRHIVGAFSELLCQGFKIDIYEPRSTDIIHEYEEYFNSCNIRFLRGKPLDVLLPEIRGGYHWGFMAFDHSHINICREHIEAALPAKIYSYLALGVPIVITDELKYAAGIVRDNGLGIIISSQDIPELNLIMSKYDYNELQKNVIQYREAVSLERHENELVSFVNMIMSGRR